MKQLAFLALAVLLLFFSASLAEQEAVTAEPIPFITEDEQSFMFADELEERFGVTILVGDECLDVIHPGSFTIGSNPPARSPLLSMLGYKGYMRELEKLEKALSQYPVELFQYIKDDNAPNGMRFFIADKIIEVNQNMWSAGYSTCEGGYYNVVLAHTFFDESSVHHEIWHSMEFHITAKYPGAFLIWDSLNPPGFQYSNDFTKTEYDLDADFFVRKYGMINASEDRATIAEAVFYSNRNEWFSEHPAIKRKLDAMNLALKDTLIIQYNVK